MAGVSSTSAGGEGWLTSAKGKRIIPCTAGKNFNWCSMGNDLSTSFEALLWNLAVLGLLLSLFIWFCVIWGLESLHSWGKCQRFHLEWQSDSQCFHLAYFYIWLHMKGSLLNSVKMDKFWVNLPGTDRQGILWSQKGTSPNAVKAQFLCRSRDEGALTTSLAGTKYLEKLDHWKHLFDIEGPDFRCGNQYLSAGKCTYVRLEKIRFVVYSTNILSMEYSKYILGGFSKK